MSKSKGNVIDPLDLIDQYGADALRFTLAAMAAQGRDIKLSHPARRGLPQLRDQALERRALRRDERLRARRTASIRQRVERDAQPLGARRMRQGRRRGDRRHRGLRFNEAARRRLPLRLERLLRLDLELAKPVLQGPDGPAKDETPRDDRLRPRRDLQAAASLHAVPHRGALGDQGRGRAPPRASVFSRSRPGRDLRHSASAEAEAEIGWVVDLVSEIRSARSETNVPAGAQMPLVAGRAVAGRAGAGRALGRHDPAPGAALGDRLRRRGAGELGAAHRARRGRGPAARGRRRPRRRARAPRQGDPEARRRDRPRSTPSSAMPTSSRARRRRSSRSSASAARRPRSAGAAGGATAHRGGC